MAQPVRARAWRSISKISCMLVLVIKIARCRHSLRHKLIDVTLFRYASEHVLVRI